MGFFFQAIKRAEGESETEPARIPLPDEMQMSVATAAAASVASSAAGSATSLSLPKRLRLQIASRIEKLVAVLSPPVLDGHVAAMEECRVIRSRVREIMREKKKKTLMLTSSSAEEGKTLISVNLAFALSHVENTRVLLVDADLR